MPDWNETLEEFELRYCSVAIVWKGCAKGSNRLKHIDEDKPKKNIDDDNGDWKRN